MTYSSNFIATQRDKCRRTRRKSSI